MTDNTINNDMTIGGATGALLAGRYRVVKQLGQGGMGSVWLAEDEKLDGHKVAVKMLPSILVSNKRAYAQVKAEALVSLRLSHPNIVTVRAFEEEGGNPFLVMDYVDGQTLDDYLAEKGKLTEEETVRLLKPVAAALDYAHEQGVVHRDVKPGNVMIRKDGTPFVLDFGIAREIQETMTRVTGKLSSGTLLYMSPEQLNGESPKPAQDIYSFAAMAYECLKGEPPFIRGGIEDQIKHKTPEALGEHIAICSQVMAGLAKSPEARPSTCMAILTAGPHVTHDCAGGRMMPTGRTQSASNESTTFVRVAILGLFALMALGGWWLLERRGREPSPDGGGVSVGANAVTNDVTNLPIDPLPQPRDDEGKRRRLELAAETAAYALAAEMENEAELVAARPEDVRDFFATEIHAFEQARKAGDAAKADSKNVMATNFFAQAKAHVNVLKKFIESRAQNLAVKEESEKAKRSADEVDAKSVLALRYSEAQQTLDRASSLMAERKFAQAIEAEHLAREKFTVLRADVIKLALDASKQYKGVGRWEACLSEAEKVLGWEAGNVEATALKEEAERNLVPTLRFVAKIGDREVKATAVIDGKSYVSPWIWNENLQPGSRIPNSDVVAEYSEDGKRYVGTIVSQVVNWKGQRTVPVALKEQKGPNPGEEMTILLPGGVTMTFCWCPATTSDDWKAISGGKDYFLMGSPETEVGRCSDETQHRVMLTEGFWMGKYEVTQRQWESVMGTNPSRFKSTDRPVEQVSWDDCQEFVRKINEVGKVTVSIPTEAQWEYACRAGTVTPLPNGSDLHILGECNGPELDCIAWYGGNACVGFDLPNGWICSVWPETQYSGNSAGTHPVGGKKANNWGLYDVIGNVEEWCLDWYGEYGGDVIDPSGPSSGKFHVNRGGSSCSWARSCRSAAREGLGAKFEYLFQRVASRGLRLVCLARKGEKHLSNRVVDICVETTGDDQSRSRSRAYAYTAKLIPYVIENGMKKSVSVTVSCGDPRINANVVNDEGRSVVSIGADVRPTGAIAVVLSTSTRSRRTWLSASDFSTNGHPMPIEIEIK